MRDLYRELGFSDLEKDPRVIERMLGGIPTGSELGTQARFVLLDPGRKQRYDQILRCALALEPVRSRLGLPGGSFLAERGANDRPSPGTPSRTPRGWWWLPWAIGVGAVLWAGTLVWTSGQPVAHAAGTEPPPAGSGKPSPGVGTPTTGTGLAAVPAEVPLAVPFPEHGWIQLSAGLRPEVPWFIETDAGQDFVLSLIDTQTRATVLTLYLRGGASYRGLAPEGVYELEFRSGTRWLGLRRGFEGGGPAIRPRQTYRVEAGPDDSWAWHLRVHPTGCEGSPVAPERSGESGDVPTAENPRDAPGWPL